MPHRFPNAPIHERYHALRDRFNELNRPTTLEALIDDLLDRAHEWRFANEDMFEPTLFPHLLEMKHKRRWAKAGAIPKVYAIEHGLAEDGTVVGMRDRFYWGVLSGREKTSYTALLRDDDGRTLETVEFSNKREGGRDLSRLRRYELDEQGHPLRRTEIMGVTGISVDAWEWRYTWEEDRLVREESTHEDWHNHGYTGPGEPIVRDDWRNSRASEGVSWRAFAYDDEGLDTITHGWGGPENTPRLEYRRPRKGETPKELAPRVEDAIVEGVVRALTHRPAGEPVFALALAFSDGQATMPPSVFLCPASWRDAVISEHAKKAKEHLWVAEDWPGVNSAGWAPAELDEISDDCAMFNMVTEAGGAYATMRKMLKGAATRLAARDWSGVLETTDDFVVLPYDVDRGLSVGSQVKACAPAERFALLKDRRLL